MTTALPDDARLRVFLETKFVGTPKDFTKYSAVLSALTPNIEQPRLIDFGCSWGYGSWQFRCGGFDVTSYEVSADRARFGAQKLGLKMVADEESLPGRQDLFFSSHVLEHVPNPSSIIELGFSKLKPEGWFVAFTPNGSLSYRKTSPRLWHLAWGQKHPQHLDEEFYTRRLADSNYLIMSSPYQLDQIDAWRRAPTQQVGRLDGSELLVVAQPPMLTKPCERG